MTGEEPRSDPDYGSRDFQTLAAAVRTYSRLVNQLRSRPTSIDPIDLLHALCDVGEASVAMVRNAGAA